MKEGKQKRDRVYLLVLAFLSLFFCWFFAGRFGVFGAKVDWISQHSVLPEYFRQQFYETGQFIPEFAPNIGGGQNIYNFSYYGLFSPVVLLSYALPFVKMGDYLMAASIAGLTAAVLIFYIWLRRRGFDEQLSFLAALLFLLARPMIYHSYTQIMFVNYMPFLCMAFLGVDRYFTKGKTGLYTVSVFLMIMTSFYFSIGGMLVLVLYGMHRYYQEQEMAGDTPAGWGRAAAFLREGIKFLLPMITAVMMSGVLLVPTAAVLMGRKGASAPKVSLQELVIPDISPMKLLYSPYGIGLTVMILVVLLAGLMYKKCSEKVLCRGCVIVLTVPMFCYLLNGGLYIRAKVLIPFLPLLCYLAAYYLRKQKNKELTFVQSLMPYLVTIGILVLQREKISNPVKWGMLLMEGTLILGCFLAFWKIRYLPLLIAPSLFCLMMAGILFRGGKGQVLEREFYESVTDEKTAEKISAVLDQEKGFYRTEEYGNTEENAADLNRIRDSRQYSSSIYSSIYNEAYQNFREETFETEEPYRNFLMQSALSNPIFRKLMGVRYVVSSKPVRGYRPFTDTGDADVYVNENVAPVIYATDRLLSEEEYARLAFPYNQTALTHYAVIEGVEQGESGWKELLKQETGETMFRIPECAQIQKTAEGYLIQTKKSCKVKVPLQRVPGRNIFFLQFKVENLHPSADVEACLEEIRNKLTADTHIYYNGNTTFTWAVELDKNQKEVELELGKGTYEISDVRAFLGEIPQMAGGKADDSLYQSQLEVDWKSTKGNRIQGRLCTEGTKCVITSIPYDENFVIRVDGKKVDYGKVNTAFLGFLVGKGNHEVEIVYHAPGVPAGRTLSCLGILLYAGIELIKRRALCLENVPGPTAQ